MWPFGKRATEPKRPPINEDWRVGDLAAATVDLTDIGGPALDGTAIVSGVYPGFATVSGTPAWALQLVGYATINDPSNGFNAAAFRKVRPAELAADRKVSRTAKPKTPHPSHPEHIG